MTEEEATETLRDAEKVAEAVFALVKIMTAPDCGIVALGLVAGTVFACLELEDDVNIDNVLDEWLLGVRAQYNAVKADMDKQQV